MEILSQFNFTGYLVDSRIGTTSDGRVPLSVMTFGCESGVSVFVNLSREEYQEYVESGESQKFGASIIPDKTGVQFNSAPILQADQYKFLFIGTQLLKQESKDSNGLTKFSLTSFHGENGIPFRVDFNWPSDKIEELQKTPSISITDGAGIEILRD